jgi:D-glycero-D-manno-heptose 1,7-bisphosphate phosphatase
MSKALFLDRDGTLIIDKHYLSDPAGVELLPGVADGLHRARELGYLLFLFSNQSGIGRGYYTLADAERVNARMEEMIGLPRPLFADVCLATEKPDEPIVYRKPSPRFIIEMLAKHRLDPAQTIMVGDRELDVEAGLKAGVRAAGIANGKLDRAAWAKFDFPGVPIYDDFAAFAKTLT